MPYFKAALRLDLPGGFAVNGPREGEAQDMRLRIYHELKLRPFSHAWAEIKLGTKKADVALERFEEEFSKSEAVIGAVHLEEYLDKAEFESAAWFKLNTRFVYNDFNVNEDYPRACFGTLPGVNALNETFVSNAFVEHCSEVGATGIEFLPCLNKGRKAGATWYATRTTASLGNGVDHPWFDRAKWAQQLPEKEKGEVQFSQPTFHQKFLAKDADLPRDVKRLLALCELGDSDSTLDGMRFMTVQRYLNSVAPDYSLAHMVQGPDTPNINGKITRYRHLAVSAELRRSLLDASLFKPKDFWALRMVNEPFGVDLDTDYPSALPSYTDEEWESLKHMKKRFDEARA